MANDQRKVKIKILKNGPYLVSDNVPLSEKKITPEDGGYEYKDGCEFLQAEKYTLCRCGKSKNPPYCDGVHQKIDFDGTETASREKFEDRADYMEGPGIDLMDDNRCALGRFCHTKYGDIWKLVAFSDDPIYKEVAIKAAIDCPAGRLVAVDKEGNCIEPEYEPSIEVLQDPEKEVSGPLFVKGSIPIESADGSTYEVRNRLALCRCGESKIKPFCDASHIPAKYIDK